MKTNTEKTTAEKVKDFSLVDPDNPNGPRKDGSTTVDVDYEYTYKILEDNFELSNEFSPSDLLKLANQRLKQTANSSARQTALKPYAQDPSSPSAVRDRMIKDMVSQNIPEDVAVAQIDALLASVKR